MSRVCRLCLTHYENGSVLNKMSMETYKVQIELILPEINLDIIKYPMICMNCTKLLMSAYMFKNLCIDNEVRIQTLLNNCLMMDVTLDELLAEGGTGKAQQDPIEIVVVNEDQQQLSFNVVTDDVRYTSESLDPETNSQIMHTQGEPTEYIILSDDSTTLKQSQSSVRSEPVVVSQQVENTKNQDKEKLEECPFCQKQMVGMKRLVWHMRLHPNRNYNCDVCNWAFDDPSELALHKETHSPKEAVIRDSIYHRCEVCGIRTLCLTKFRMHVEEHVREGRGVKRKYCEVCDLQFVKNADFENHMRQHKVNRMEHLASSRNEDDEEILPT